MTKADDNTTTSRLSVDVTPEEKRQLKILAAKRDTTITEIVRAAIRKEIRDAEQPKVEA